MRWDRLFDDLEGQLERELSAEELDLRAEEERLRIGRLTVRDRLIAIREGGNTTDQSVALLLVTGEQLVVRPSTFGRDWFLAELAEEGRRSQCVVPLAGVAALLLARSQIESSLAQAENPANERSLSARLTLPFVLRDLCRRRAAVSLHTAAGDAHGTIDRVGRDHLDLAVHEHDRPRRSRVVSQYRVVPLGQLLLVRL
jgi:hypothetical protein